MSPECKRRQWIAGVIFDISPGVAVVSLAVHLGCCVFVASKVGGRIRYGFRTERKKVLQGGGEYKCGVGGSDNKGLHHTPADLPADQSAIV